MKTVLDARNAIVSTYSTSEILHRGVCMCMVECTCLRRYLLCVNIISYSYVYICYYVWRLHCIIKNLVIERMGHKSSPIHSLTNIEQEVVVVERTKYRLLLLNLMFEKKIKWLGLLTIRSVSNQYIILNKYHMLMSLNFSIISYCLIP